MSEPSLYHFGPILEPKLSYVGDELDPVLPGLNSKHSPNISILISVTYLIHVHCYMNLVFVISVQYFNLRNQLSLLSLTLHFFFSTLSLTQVGLSRCRDSPNPEPKIMNLVLRPDPLSVVSDT